MKRIYYDSPDPPAPGDLLAPISRVTGSPTRYYQIVAVREVRRISRSTPGPRWNLDVVDARGTFDLLATRVHPLHWYPRGRRSGDPSHR